MARQRMVKPDFFASESLGACRPEARLAFIGLWVNADDKGHLKCQFGRLRREVFRYDSMTDMSFAYLLAELEQVGCIYGYEVDGERYLCVPNFLTYQNVNHPSKTNIPKPPEGGGRKGMIAAWIAELWPVPSVDNPVENTALSECSGSAHPNKLIREEENPIPRFSSSSQVEGRAAAVEKPVPCPPSIAETFRRIFA